MPGPSAAAESYNWWAEAYDECNPENDYEHWLGESLLPLLEGHGLRRGWALDIGCGTGLAFPPLLRRGWRIVGCDSSVGMLAAAEQKVDGAVRLMNLDVRDLPPISPNQGDTAQQAFSLILMLNDVINYLTGDGDLIQAFAGIAKNLRPDGGLAVLDANTVALFRRDYELGCAANLGSNGWRWRGVTKRCVPEQIYEAELQDPSGLVRPHRQRHWSRDQILGALAAAGLHCVAILGQREEAGQIQLCTSPSETRDLKILYLVSHLPANS